MLDKEIETDWQKFLKNLDEVGELKAELDKKIAFQEGYEAGYLEAMKTVKTIIDENN